MKNLFFIILSSFLVVSCEKEITLDLDDKSGNIVIEANITDQPGPYFVRITKSIAFTQENEYPPVENTYVSLVDDLGQSEVLKYAGKGVYQTTFFQGQSGRTYTLRIMAEGKEYIAQSTMPDVVNFEGLEQDSFMVGGEISYTLLPIFTDPPALGNRYLFSYNVNNRSKNNFQEFSDNINNGLLNQRPLILPNDDEDGSAKVKVGDTINVEMRCIDEKVYTYYSALLQLSNGGANGGVTPANPPSNINNGALGYFSAHTVRKRTTIIN
jgi:hypothetical protein